MARLREAWGVAPHERVVLVAARLTEWKGQKVLDRGGALARATRARGGSLHPGGRRAGAGGLCARDRRADRKRRADGRRVAGRPLRRHARGAGRRERRLPRPRRRRRRSAAARSKRRRWERWSSSPIPAPRRRPSWRRRRRRRSFAPAGALRPATRKALADALESALSLGATRARSARPTRARPRRALLLAGANDRRHAGGLSHGARGLADKIKRFLATSQVRSGWETARPVSALARQNWTFDFG